MTGKLYYITTLGDWQRHAARFANSHFIALDLRPPEANIATGVRHPVPSAAFDQINNLQSVPDETLTPQTGASQPPTETFSGSSDATRILVLIEADEGVHLALEDEPTFEALPHPLAQKPISDSAQNALAPHGVSPGTTTFDVAETLARVHPLLRHRVF